MGTASWPVTVQSTFLDLSTEAIDSFLSKTILGESFGVELADRVALDPISGADFLSDLASEARLACRILAELGPTGEMRMLEVGAGAGVVAAFLNGQGANLVAIEPTVGGFELFDAAHALLAGRVVAPAIEPIAADQLDPAEHGPFDLIFSINVIEHMRPLAPNLDALAAVLAPGGRMIHTCPNYRVPYEPHFQIVLVPGRPALTRFLARHTSRDRVWGSLNWVTAGDVMRFASRHQLVLEFRRNALASTLERLRSDDAFSRRQQGLVARGLGWLDAMGVAHVFNLIPPEWMTPMTFVISKPA